MSSSSISERVSAADDRARAHELCQGAADEKLSREVLRLMRKFRTDILDLEMADAGEFGFRVLTQPKPKAPRLAMLKGSEAILLFETASFLMWRYGVWFNMSVTIVPKLMGISDERFIELMPRWNKAMKKWLAVPLERHSPQKARQRRPRRPLPAEPHPHYWMYVYEHGRDAGLHVHELCVVPKEVRGAFEEQTRKWWAAAAGRAIPGEAIGFRRSSERRAGAGQETFHRVRYLLKSMDRTATIMHEGQVHLLAAIFKPEPHHEPSYISVAQIYGRCHELSACAQQEGDIFLVDKAQGSYKERRQEQFVSKLRAGEFHQLASGWELDAHDHRRLLASLWVW